jgi:hypothetical protein
LLVALACAGAATATGRAWAEDCPTRPDAVALTDAEVELRLAFLADTFDREVRNVDAWSWTWGSVYAAGAAAQATVAGVTKDTGVREGLTVGAISTGIGSVSLYVLPLTLTLPLRSAERRWDDPDRCTLLELAERALADGAKHEALSNGIVPHIGNVVANAAVALVLGLGFHLWTSAAISAGSGLAVGEANVFTQPHGLGRAEQRYRTGDLSRSRGGGTWSVIVLRVEGGGAGLAARLVF